MNFKFQKETDTNLVSLFLNEYGTLQGFYHAILTKAWNLFNKVRLAAAGSQSIKERKEE